MKHTTLVTATYQSLDYGNNGPTLVVNREIPQASEWEVEPMTSGQTRIGEERYQRLTTIESGKYQNVKKASSVLLLKLMNGERWMPDCLWLVGLDQLGPCSALLLKTETLHDTTGIWNNGRWLVVRSDFREPGKNTVTFETSRASWTLALL